MHRISLPFDTSSAKLARRGLREWLVEVDRSSCEDAGMLLVTELVTNSILHARTAVELRLEVSPGGVHVEVADSSPVRPTVNKPTSESLTGRGLAMVDQVSSAWGVRRERSGKAVWFQLGAPDSSLVGPDEDGAEVDQGDLVNVQLAGMPSPLRITSHQHDEALTRELALIAFDPGHPLSGPVSELIGAAQRARATLSAAWAGSGQGFYEGGVASVPVPRSVLGDLADLVRLLQLADELAEAGQMLTPPTLPELRTYRHWGLAEVISQLEGAEPTPWRDREPVANPVWGVIGADAVLDELGEGVVVADSSNHIIYTNRVLERLLGWEPGGLVGQRLVAIIPKRFRDAHLAGFTRFLLTRHAQVLGRPLWLRASTRDGGEVAVEVVITAFTWEDRPVFVGRVKALAGEDRADATAPRHGGMAAVNEVAMQLAVAGDVSLATVGPKALGAVGQGLGFGVGSLWLTSGDRLVHRVWWQDQPGHERLRDASVRATLDRHEGLPGRVLDAGGAEWVPDLSADGSLRAKAAVSSGLVGAVAFALSYAGRPVGVAEFFTDATVTPSDDQRAVVEALGALLGLYLGGRRRNRGQPSSSMKSSGGTAGL